MGQKGRFGGPKREPQTRSENREKGRQKTCPKTYRTTAKPAESKPDFTVWLRGRGGQGWGGRHSRAWLELLDLWRPRTLQGRAGVSARFLPDGGSGASGGTLALPLSQARLIALTLAMRRQLPCEACTDECEPEGGQESHE